MLCPSPSHASLRPLLLILHRLIMHLLILFLRLLNFLSVLPDCDVRYGAGRVQNGRDGVQDGRLGRFGWLASLAALAYREGRDGTGVRAGRDVMVRCGL